MVRVAPAQRPPRLGFAVKVLGRRGLKSHDTRRWQSDPHLRVSLNYLRAIFSYLDEIDVRMYRMASGLAPYATHPELPQFHGQVEQCAEELAELGKLAGQLDLRLSLHPSQYIVLNSVDEDVAARSAADVELHAAILEAMGLGDEAVVVLHVGGVYGDRVAALARFARRCEQLSPGAQRRLVVENDDTRFGVEDVLWVHRKVGVRVVFDAHHFQCHNVGGMALEEAARTCLATWEGWGARAKVHFSSPRTDWGFRHGSKEKGSAPNWAAHAEFVDPFGFIAFYRPLVDLAPDVILEAKAKDVALIQLRSDLVEYAPDIAGVFGFEK
ncbi:MAG: UV DNA damage repair endonuclease UvsE [Anaerolineae bacterium]|jgi:UV DNA damage endonuclease